MANFNRANLEDTLQPKERQLYGRLPDTERDGYFVYREDMRDPAKDGKPRRQGHLIVAGWRKLTQAEKDAYITRAAARVAPQAQAAQGGRQVAKAGEAGPSAGGPGSSAAGSRSKAGEKGPSAAGSRSKAGASGPSAAGSRSKAGASGPSAGGPVSSAAGSRSSAREPGPSAGRPSAPTGETSVPSDLDEERSTRGYRSPTTASNKSITAAIVKEKPGTWKYLKTLYDRAADDSKDDQWTLVCLYVKVDDKGAVTDRVVVKKYKVLVPPLPGQKNIIGAAEMKFMNRLNKVNCDSLLHPIIASHNSSRAIKDDPHYHIYTPFAAFGDLSEMITRYSSKEEGTPSSQIPEPFIWLVFRELSEAIFAHQFGLCWQKIQTEKVPPKRWKPIVHQDIKPANVFLMNPVAPYSAYPRPVLGDYGLADELTSTEVAMEDRGTGAAGTPGYMAPEVKYEEHGLPRSEKIDVFSVGVVIWHLMHTQMDQTVVEEGRDNMQSFNSRFLGAETALPMGRDFTDQSCYSHGLVDLVARCIRVRPGERPDSGELRRTIEREMGNLERLTGPFTGPSIPEHLVLKGPEEEFPIGTRPFPTQPRKRKRDDTADDADRVRGRRQPKFARQDELPRRGQEQSRQGSTSSSSSSDPSTRPSRAVRGGRAARPERGSGASRSRRGSTTRRSGKAAPANPPNAIYRGSSESQGVRGSRESQSGRGSRASQSGRGSTTPRSRKELFVNPPTAPTQGTQGSQGVRGSRTPQSGRISKTPPAKKAAAATPSTAVHQASQRSQSVRGSRTPQSGRVSKTPPSRKAARVTPPIALNQRSRGSQGSGGSRGSQSGRRSRSSRSVRNYRPPYVEDAPPSPPFISYEGTTESPAIPRTGASQAEGEASSTPPPVPYEQGSPEFPAIHTTREPRAEEVAPAVPGMPAYETPAWLRELVGTRVATPSGQGSPESPVVHETREPQAEEEYPWGPVPGMPRHETPPYLRGWSPTPKAPPGAESRGGNATRPFGQPPKRRRK